MDKIHPYTGPKIRYYRKALGWALRDLERHSGVPFGLIGNYERRKTAVPYDQAARLAKALDVSLSTLWDLTPPPGTTAAARNLTKRRKRRASLKIVQ